MQSKILDKLRSVSVHKKRFFLFLPVVLVGLIVLGVYHRQIWEYLLELTAAFQSIETARAYIAGYGALAPVISAILMIFQSVIAPLPAFLITFANGLLFGVWWGAALSWSSAMLGAALCFFIARLLGRPVIVRLLNESAVNTSDRFFQRYGKHAVLIARLIPVISFDAISYGAGLTDMRFLGFAIATGIGQLPATLLYSYLGDRVTRSIKALFWGFGLVISVSIIIGLVKQREKA
ncbi:TVP38/TMEM64 family protein [Candidatus Poribacteria bacterium]|nr:MAG: TVP38/TMEM64 family protein [Candidatus Poribacteria bacterium]